MFTDEGRLGILAIHGGRQRQHGARREAHHADALRVHAPLGRACGSARGCAIGDCGARLARNCAGSGRGGGVAPRNVRAWPSLVFFQVRQRPRFQAVLGTEERPPLVWGARDVPALVVHRQTHGRRQADDPAAPVPAGEGREGVTSPPSRCARSGCRTHVCQTSGVLAPGSGPVPSSMALGCAGMAIGAALSSAAWASEANTAAKARPANPTRCDGPRDAAHRPKTRNLFHSASPLKV